MALEEARINIFPPASEQNETGISLLEPDILNPAVSSKAPAEEYRRLEHSGTMPVSAGLRCRSDLSHPGQPGADVRQ